MIRHSLKRAALGFVVLAPGIVLPPCAGAAEPLKPEPAPFALTRNFDGPVEDGAVAPAYDISGAACAPAAPDGTRSCLVVNDENAGAQFFVLRDTTLSPGQAAYDLGAAPSPEIRGTAPTPSEAAGCTGGKGTFDQLDGEAVAYAAPHFYVTGSHGCTRGKRKYKLSSMILTRLRTDAAGTAARETVGTYRLSDALRAAAPVDGFLLRDLELDWNVVHPPGTPEPNGLNVEGLAVVGGVLYAGLRGPSLRDTAYLIPVPLEPLFAPGEAPLTAAITPIPLALGRDAGIRDLAALDDGRLLVLAGPARNGLDVPYTLSIAELPSGRLTPLGTLEPVRGRNAKGKLIDGKPEAIVRLGPGRVLVMFDSLLNGAPHAYAVPVP